MSGGDDVKVGEMGEMGTDATGSEATRTDGPPNVDFGEDGGTRLGPARRGRPERLVAGEPRRQAASGRLVFWIHGKRYAGALTALREVLAVVPPFTPVPLSPPWLLGIFPLRTELVTLVEPWPFLLRGEQSEATPSGDGVLSGAQALLVGENGRLVALVVDRVGDIVGADSPAPPSDSADTAPLDDADVLLLSEAPGLDLTALYTNLIDNLESWARNV